MKTNDSTSALSTSIMHVNLCLTLKCTGDDKAVDFGSQGINHQFIIFLLETLLFHKICNLGSNVFDHWD